MKKFVFLACIFLLGCGESYVTKISILPTIGPGISPSKGKVGISLEGSSMFYPYEEHIFIESGWGCNVHFGVTNRAGITLGKSIKGYGGNVSWEAIKYKSWGLIICGGGTYPSDVKAGVTFLPYGSIHLTMKASGLFTPYAAYRFEKVVALISSSDINLQKLISEHITAFGVEIALSDKVFLRNEGNLAWLYNIPIFKDDSIQEINLTQIARLSACIVIRDF